VVALLCGGFAEEAGIFSTQPSNPIPREDFMILQEKSEALTRSLREAFGVTEFEDISRITGGIPCHSSFALSCADRHTC